MRLLHVFVKSVREMRREALMLALTLVFAPLFVFIYWLYFSQSPTSYKVLIVNQDLGVVTPSGDRLAAGDGLVAALRAVKGAGGGSLLTASESGSVSSAESALKDRDAAAALVIPADFSRALAAAAEGRSAHEAASLQSTLVIVGDLTNPSYSVAAVLAGSVADRYVREVTHAAALVQMVERPLGASGGRTDFETTVPGVLVFAVIMLVFLAAMTVAREVEAGTLRRLQITRMTAVDLLGGTSGALVLVGVASVLLTFATASLLGFHSRGPLWVAILVGAVLAVAIIGCGLVVAAFSKNVAQAFVIANFPLGLLMFFSGVMFPMPRTTLFSVAGRGISPFDVLPPTHAVIALNKVLTMGAGLRDVLWELTALVVLSAGYYAAGVWLFRRLRMKPS